jgi:hypothetical protein
VRFGHCGQNVASSLLGPHGLVSAVVSARSSVARALARTRRLELAPLARRARSKESRRIGCFRDLKTLLAPITPGVRTQQIPLERLVEAPWNPNRVAPSLLRKVRASIERFGVVENLVARPHPSEPGKLEVISGNHRLRLYRELGHKDAPVVLVEVDDGQARLLAQTLNRSRGTDDPAAYAALLEQILSEYGAPEVVGLLPETEATLERALAPSDRSPRSADACLVVCSFPTASNEHVLIAAGPTRRRD